jgi:hypothetical protein
MYYEQSSITNENLELENKTTTLKIYINGVLTAAKKDWAQDLTELPPDQIIPFYLNYSESDQKYGYTDFRICRAYSVGLNPHEILWNYISSLNQIEK